VDKCCLVSRGSRCGSVATCGKGDKRCVITCLHMSGEPSCLRLPWCIIMCNPVLRKLSPAAVLMHRPAATRLMGLWVRIPLMECILVCYVLCNQRRADHSFREDLEFVCVYNCVWSRHLETRLFRHEFGCCATDIRQEKGKGKRQRLFFNVTFITTQHSVQWHRSGEVKF